MALGNRSRYISSWALAYSWPNPPLKITTSSGASSLTPNGFFGFVTPWVGRGSASLRRSAHPDSVPAAARAPATATPCTKLRRVTGRLLKVPGDMGPPGHNRIARLDLRRRPAVDLETAGVPRLTVEKHMPM